MYNQNPFKRGAFIQKPIDVKLPFWFSFRLGLFLFIMKWRDRVRRLWRLIFRGQCQWPGCKEPVDRVFKLRVQRYTDREYRFCILHNFEFFRRTDKP